MRRTSPCTRIIGGRPGGQVQVGGLVLDDEGEQFGDIHIQFLRSQRRLSVQAHAVDAVGKPFGRAERIMPLGIMATIENACKP